MSMEKTDFKGVKSIQFKWFLDGVGCVNFDSNEQLQTNIDLGIVKWGDDNFFNNGKKLSNVNFTKKNYVRNEDGKVVFHHKVSSEALRNTTFKKYMVCQVPNVVNEPYTYYTALSHPVSIIRGYLFPEKGGCAVNKKSSWCVTDAEEIGPYRDCITMDFHSRSGEKSLNNGKGEDDSKDNTIYKTESVGHCKYCSEGAIDVQEMRFISADPIYNRMAVNVDGGLNEQIYVKALEMNMVNFKPEFKYYYLDSLYTKDGWAERGILLNDESLSMLINMLIKDMVDMQRYTRNAYLKTEKLVLYINTEDGREIVEFTPDNYENLTFNCVNHYLEANEELILANRDKVNQAKNKKNNSKQK